MRAYEVYAWPELGVTAGRRSIPRVAVRDFPWKITNPEGGVGGSPGELCGPLITWNLNGFNLPPICTSDSDCLPVTGLGSVCINMNPNCDAVENKGCAAPCPGGKVVPGPGMKVVHA